MSGGAYLKNEFGFSNKDYPNFTTTNLVSRYILILNWKPDMYLLGR